MEVTDSDSDDGSGSHGRSDSEPSTDDDMPHLVDVAVSDSDDDSDSSSSTDSDSDDQDGVPTSASPPPPPASAGHDPDLLAGGMSAAWLARDMTHAELAAAAKSATPARSQPTRRAKRAVTIVEYVRFRIHSAPDCVSLTLRAD